MKYIVLLPLLLFFVTACDKGDDDKISGRTILVYMAADNSLSDFSYQNLNSMVAGAEGENLNGGNLLVYVDSKSDVPYLYHIKKGNGGVIEKEVVKTYEEHNSASKEVMRSVFSEVFNSGKYKAESYGLILWSHGTSWLPSDIKNYLRSYGEDSGNHMEINTLKETLSGYYFDFLIFDACYMAGIEVVYTLRDVADYILASPTEIMGSGFPYQNVVKTLFASGSTETMLKNTGQAFYDYYNAQSGVYQSASVSLVKTDALLQLATATRKILSNKTEEDLFAVSVHNLQRLEYLRSMDHALYDFEDYVKQLASESQYAEFKQSLSNAVLYKATTEYAFYGYPQYMFEIDPDRFCGLSSYVPQSQLTDLNEWYKDLEWYQAAYVQLDY